MAAFALKPPVDGCAEPIPCTHPRSKPDPAHYGGDTITILVGPPGSERKFTVYRALICHYSAYFDRMVNGAFTEAEQDTLQLADVDPRSFQSFVYWLHTGIVDCYDDCADNYEDFGFSASIAKAYIFADYHGAPCFKNDLLDNILFSLEISKKGAMINSCLIYDNTVEGDALRRMAIDVGTEMCNLKRFKKENLDDYHPEFMFDFIMACKDKEIVPASAPFVWADWVKNLRKNFCKRYHDHSTPEARHAPDAVLVSAKDT